MLRLLWKKKLSLRSMRKLLSEEFLIAQFLRRICFYPLRQLLAKQDSIANSINAFIEQYESVTVENKSYNKSSFSRANNVDSVDSVEAIVYGNK